MKFWCLMHLEAFRLTPLSLIPSMHPGLQITHTTPWRSIADITSWHVYWALYSRLDHMLADLPSIHHQSTVEARSCLLAAPTAQNPVDQTFSVPLAEASKRCRWAPSAPVNRGWQHQLQIVRPMSETSQAPVPFSDSSRSLSSLSEREQKWSPGGK